jgi:hypothetical protein
MLHQITAYEFNILLLLTIVLLIGKGILVAFLGYKIIERKKKTGEFSMGFVFGVFIMILSLLISRIFYSMFDFYYSAFDSSTFHKMPNVIFWKLGAFISVLGYALFLYITDKRVLDFKLKAIPAIILLVIVILILIFPVNLPQDFQIVAILPLFANIVAIIIPVVFFILARKKTPFRIPSFAVAFGVIIYAIGGNITMEPLLNALAAATGSSMRVPMFSISLIFKLAGLFLFSYGITQFAIKFSKE